MKEKSSQGLQLDVHGLQLPTDFQTPLTARLRFYFVVFASGAGKCLWERRTWEAQHCSYCCEHPARIHPAT